MMKKRAKTAKIITETKLQYIKQRIESYIQYMEWELGPDYAKGGAMPYSAGKRDALKWVLSLMDQKG